MQNYYELRQLEYEAIYAKPERQHDLVWLEDNLNSLVAGQRVLEIACGTGYWTRRMSNTATSVYATDVSQQLATAAVASCCVSNVTGGTIDAFEMSASPGFECVVAGFFFSHVLIAQRDDFLARLIRAFDHGTRIIIFDNRYVEGSSTPVSKRMNTGDTYQTRYLSDGSTHEVLKNFPTTAELQATLAKFISAVNILESRYFWLATGVSGS